MTKLCKKTTRARGCRYNRDEAWAWLQRQNSDAAPGRTFHITARKLMGEWNRSAHWVMAFLKQLEEVGAIQRRVLPNNGGTLITLTGRSAHHNEPAEHIPATASRDHIHRLIDNLPPVLSAQQAARLTRAYEDILYGKPGYEWAGVKHLEIIEQALCPPWMQQTAHLS